MSESVEQTLVRKDRDVSGDWASAAYHLFATGMMMPLGPDLVVGNAGLGLPDADLDSLCDAIMRDISHSVAVEVEREDATFKRNGAHLSRSLVA